MSGRFLSISLVLMLANAVSVGAVINVPPVEISGLGHVNRVVLNPIRPAERLVADGVSSYGMGAFSGPGFTAGIRQGDNIVTRFQAPSGMRFAVIPRADAAITYFVASATWLAGSDGTRQYPTPTVTFDNVLGPAPTMDYHWNGVGDLGNAVHTQVGFTLTAPFSFTALEVRFAVPHQLAGTVKTYGPVRFDNEVGFGATCRVPLSAPDQSIMRIEPVPSPGTGALAAVGMALVIWKRDPAYRLQ